MSSPSRSILTGLFSLIKEAKRYFFVKKKKWMIAEKTQENKENPDLKKSIQ
jgi:hypothetical protein